VNNFPRVRNDHRSALPQPSRMSRRLALETTLLRHARVVAVGACYEGEDGDGAFSPVLCLGEDKNDISHTVNPTVRRRIESFFRALLDERYHDWREGHGSQGRFLWLIQSDRLEHEHEVRRITYQAQVTVDL
jgi:hypothetical protein